MKQLILQLVAIIGLTLLAGTASNLVGRRDTQAADGTATKEWHFSSKGARLEFFVKESRYPNALICMMSQKKNPLPVNPEAPKDPPNGGEPEVVDATQNPGGTQNGAVDPGKQTQNPEPEDPNKVPHIGFEAAVQHWEDGLLFVDARGPKYYAEGHIPGAISIPAWEPGIEEKVQQLAETEGTAAPIVVYCNESTECEDSHIVASQMKSFDFQELTVYEGGFPGWRRDWKKKNKTEKDSEIPITTGPEAGPRGPEQ
ncbi:MAG: rhodanese-like domain-containing protein [Planctomycetota bacterium]